MTTTLPVPTPAFSLDPAHGAHEPPEARGVPRDQVRLLVSRGDDEPVDARFDDLGAFLDPGDLLVVNTTATVPAALDGRLPSGEPVVVHVSGALPGDVWLVEVRQPAGGATAPRRLGHADDVALMDGGHIRLLSRFGDSARLWIAALDLGADSCRYLHEHGRPIRYKHVDHDWPLAAYQTVFARDPGSAEMPSASRPFTAEVVTDLVARGVLVAPVLLHTGVSSLEGEERPCPEHYDVPETTAALANAVRDRGGQVIAAGTTVVRALATVTDIRGVVQPGRGWTDVVVTCETPVVSVDGLLTGWHEPESTHLWMLGAFASAAALQRAYQHAVERGYLWHEFGDSHLILREHR